MRSSRAGIPGVRPNGHPTERLPGTLNVSFPDLDVGDLLGALPDVAASAGSSCASLNSGPSHVLKAMGLGDDAYATFRFGLGRFTTTEEVERAAALVVRAASAIGGYETGSARLAPTTNRQAAATASMYQRASISWARLLCSIRAEQEKRGLAYS